MKQNTLIHKLVPLLLLAVLPVIAQALDYTCTTNNGAITITGYTGSGGDVSIPTEINGLPVTVIESMASSYTTTLTSITIPESVVSIGTYAFERCDITNITIGTSVTNIGDYAFSYCFALTSITIPESVVYIGDYAFYYCDSLTNVTISDSVTSIGQSAFHYCLSLTNVEFGNCVTSIGSHAFWNCLDLTSVTIPDSVTSIGVETFYACHSLTNVTIGSGVTSIENDTFRSCGLTSVSISDGVAAIGDNAFSSCNWLRNITIPDSVTFIGDDAFSWCRMLNEIKFRGDAPSLGSSSAFYNSTNVTVYYLPSTTGWEAMFGERPTAVWKPQIEVGGENFGISTNQFGFSIVWASNQVVVVEANTSLTNSVWQPLQTNTLSTDSLYFSDTQWTDYPTRFYRISSP